ncbi:MAG: hypothetical protein V2I33_25475 [Kangiellaceae bacterium]|jgi:beta-glucosidase|nr:hypothetical protein [Kangiellaceae bacterium]
MLPVDITAKKYIVLTGERDVKQRYSWGPEIYTTYQDFDNVGAQSGGWTLAWQGYEGNEFWLDENKITSGAETILDAVTKRVDGDQTTLLYNVYTNTTDAKKVAAARKTLLDKIDGINDMTAENTLIIGVVSENPYAEWMGDVNNPFCQDFDAYNENGCMYLGSWLNPY